jgi:RNA polymerase sigma factor (sigma-70 family)
MPRTPFDLFRAVLRRRAADAEPASDAALLARFAAAGDQAAFELLLWRHAALVLGVCRRVLRDDHLAEDAFQATFLILSRKAGTVRGSLAGWLHRVARRVAVRAARRRPTAELTDVPAPADAGDPELRRLLDEEIDRLPERFQLPVVLCYLDGRPTEEAARLLGVPRGTVLSRLATARARLAGRLSRRGVTLPAAVAVTAVTAETVGGAMRAAGGGTALALAREVLRMWAWKKAAAVAATAVAMAGVGGMVAWVGSDQPAVAQAPANKPVAQAPTNRPVGPATVPPAEQKQAAERLRAASQDILKQIDELQLQLWRVRQQSDVDPRAVQAAIDRLDARISTEEENVAVLNESVAAATEKLRMMPPSTDRPPQGERSAAGRLLRDAEAKLQRLTGAHTELARRLGDADSPQIKQSLAAVREASEEVKRLEQEATEVAKQRQQAQDRRTAENSLAGHTHALARAERTLARLQMSRREYAQRLAACREAGERSRLIEDELNALRDIRVHLLRQRLAVELGVPVPAASSAAADVGDRLDRLARQVDSLASRVAELAGKLPPAKPE